MHCSPKLPSSYLLLRACALACVVATGAACKSNNNAAGGFVVGLPLPYTGDNANSGSTIERAVYLAAEEINAAGGINGTQVSIRTYDTHSAALSGYEAMNAAIADGPSAILGPDSSALVPALQPAASQAGILVITPGETYPVAGEPSPPSEDLWVQLNPVVQPLAEKVASSLATTLSASSGTLVAFCYVDDRYGQDYLLAFSKKLEPLGFAVRGFPFQPNAQVGPDAVAALAAAGADAVVMVTPPAVAAELVNGVFLQASNASGTVPPFYFGPTLQSTVFTRSVIQQAVGGGFGVAPSTSDPANAFPERYAERWYGDTPNNAAFFYYDAMWYLALHAQAAAKDLGVMPGPVEIYAKMQSAGTDPDASQVLWSTASIFLNNLEPQATFVYLGVTGAITLQSTGQSTGSMTNGIRNLNTPYLVTQWKPSP